MNFKVLARTFLIALTLRSVALLSTIRFIPTTKTPSLSKLSIDNFFTTTLRLERYIVLYLRLRGR